MGGYLLSKFFKICGMAVLIACAILFIGVLVSPNQNAFLILPIILSAIFALLLIAVGDLMDRVDYLENKLELYPTQDKHEDHIMQIACPNCGKKYDMDYPKCPYCGNSLSEVKNEQ